mmetsp:Transcript_74382/g.206496  ORF Transcript_74382/g.206496 Transcript_74382/m.206496 type:complete len:248 (-) Transcript_74382:251-994(-)
MSKSIEPSWPVAIQSPPRPTRTLTSWVAQAWSMMARATIAVAASTSQDVTWPPPPRARSRWPMRIEEYPTNVPISTTRSPGLMLPSKMRPLLPPATLSQEDSSAKRSIAAKTLARSPRVVRFWTKRSTLCSFFANGPSMEMLNCSQGGGGSACFFADFPAECSAGSSAVASSGSSNSSSRSPTAGSADASPSPSRTTLPCNLRIKSSFRPDTGKPSSLRRCLSCTTVKDVKSSPSTSTATAGRLARW